MEKLFLTVGEANRLKEVYPNRIPIFVTKSLNTKDVADLPKHKFLIPSDMTVGQFIFVIRRQIKMPPEKALFIFIGNMIPTSTSLLSELYDKYKSPDGALRIVYTSENTFGI